VDLALLEDRAGRLDHLELGLELLDAPTRRRQRIGLEALDPHDGIPVGGLVVPIEPHIGTMTRCSSDTKSQSGQPAGDTSPGFTGAAEHKGGSVCLIHLTMIDRYG
jgi:hypothetical protein